jgi:hypothetical protein
MKIRIPDENAPGFLRRERLRLEFLNAAGNSKVNAMVVWLSEYIEDDDKEKALENASEAEISELMDAITGIGADPKGSESTEDGSA